MTLAPRSANNSAEANPIPELPPNTRAVLPSNSLSIVRRATQFLSQFVSGDLNGLGIVRNRLFGECRTSTWRFRPAIAAALDSNGLFEAILDPGNIFQHCGRRMPERQMYMHLSHVAHMRDYR